MMGVPHANARHGQSGAPAGSRGEGEARAHAGIVVQPLYDGHIVPGIQHLLWAEQAGRCANGAAA